MALKNNWNDLVDGESFVEVDPINRMAHAIIANEENILSVQKLGESIQAENKSQEAEINELSKDLTRFENNAVRLDSKINENEKRITNLEKGIPSDLFLTDSSIAYSKNVPQNALPYAEVRKIGGMTYKDGDTLRSAPVTEVESVGANLFGGDALADKIVENFGGTKDEADKTVSFNAANSNSTPIYSNFKENTRYTFILRIKNDVMARTNIVVDYADGTFEQFPLSTTGAFVKVVATSAVGKTVKRFGATYSGGVTVLRYDECGIFEGVLTEADFKPYTRNTLPIPEAVQALDGYGDGVNESVYNYIDFETKQFVKRVGKVDLGTLNWKSGLFVGSFSALLKDAVDMAYGGGGVCSKYDVHYSNDNKSLYTTKVTSEVGCVVVDSDYTDAATFKTAMSGVMLYYELATPVVTDISDLLLEDNFIGVEGNGTITMINQYKYNVPSEIVFMLNEV